MWNLFHVQLGHNHGPMIAPSDLEHPPPPDSKPTTSSIIKATDINSVGQSLTPACHAFNYSGLNNKELNLALQFLNDSRLQDRVGDLILGGANDTNMKKTITINNVIQDFEDEPVPKDKGVQAPIGVAEANSCADANIASITNLVSKQASTSALIDDRAPIKKNKKQLMDDRAPIKKVVAYHLTQNSHVKLRKNISNGIFSWVFGYFEAQ
ncbi:uncharacterized protein MELLADRAFT_113769 [Melampsora larici-populina 98AG31]|uniref:Uncharacterized protein n=1 Tax=Melampsora larici-populina (strain 98AG31 / pathotype 3-4-7) TaxID=747676 RepID=F4SB04_MELLP|nr:uncharacterized protein MELLADRAFT_113769 [Melampsora larici-populina 98AG31]EGF98174.1 hypothetical protein MELLADRAFT_113769 [Melampsora larici-populina 98AG31]